MTLKPCHKAFNSGEAYRADFPLTSGYYKICDALRVVNRMEATVREIRDHLKGVRTHNGDLLGSCTIYDKHIWLKSVPTIVSRILGEQVQPGIIALRADGVATYDVANILADIEPQISRLVNLCEQHHYQMRRGIQHEYTHIKNGSSCTMEIIHTAREIIVTILLDAGLPF